MYCYVNTQVFSLSLAVSSYANRGSPPDRVHNQTQRPTPCMGLSQVEKCVAQLFTHSRF